jgi:putative ABC transport system permease protein
MHICLVYAAKTIRAKKRKYIFIGVAILLSILLMASFLSYMLIHKNNEILSAQSNYGHYHFKVNDINNKQLHALRKYKGIEPAGYQYNIAFSSIKGDKKIQICEYNNTALKALNISIKEGVLPAKNNEIAIEEWVGGLFYRNLKIGDHIILKLEDMTRYEALNPQAKARKNVKSISKEFIVSGILNNRVDTQLSNCGISIVNKDVLTSINYTNAFSKMRYTAYIRVKKVSAIRDTIKKLESGLGVSQSQLEENSQLLSILNQSMDQKDNNYYIYITFLFSIIIAGCIISIIYGSVTILLSESQKEICTINKIGATIRQIKKIFLFQILLVNCIVSFISIMMYFFIIEMIMVIFGINLKDTFGDNFSPIFIITGSILFISVITTISSLVPIMSITKFITKEKVNFISKSIKMSAAFQREPTSSRALLTSRNIRFNRKKYLVSSISVTICVMIFIIINSYVEHNVDEIFVENSYGNVNYDLHVNVLSEDTSTSYSRKDINDISKIKGVENVYAILADSVFSNLPKPQIDSDFFDFFKTYGKKYGLELNRNKDNKFQMPSNLFGYSNKLINMCKKYTVDGDINVDEMNKQNGVIIYQTNVTDIIGNSPIAYEKFSNLKVGSEINITPAPWGSKSRFKFNSMKLKVKAIVNDLPIKIGGGLISIAVPEKVFEKMDKRTYFDFAIQLKDKNFSQHEKTKIQIKKIIERQSQGTMIDDRNVIVQWERNKIRKKITVYSLMIIIILITSLNLFNTITSNYMLRIREIGMLRAIGMTKRQVIYMLSFENIIFGVKGVVSGSLLGVMLSFILFKITDKAIQAVWKFPIEYIIMSIILVTLICVITSIGPIKRLFRISEVEAIKD